MLQFHSGEIHLGLFFLAIIPDVAGGDGSAGGEGTGFLFIPSISNTFAKECHPVLPVAAKNKIK